MSDYALFVMAPFVAALFFVVGTAARIVSAAPGAEPPASGSSAPDRFSRRRRTVLTIAWLGVFAGHVWIFAAPDFLRAWNQDLPRLIGLELVLFAFGLTILAGMLFRGRNARRTSSGSIDTAFFGLLLVAVATGLLVAARYRWASAWSTVTLTPYLRSLFDLRPDLDLVATLPYFVKLHVFAGTVLFALFPFTRTAGVLSNTVQRAVGRCVVPLGAAITHRARQVSEGGRNVIWPEEEN